MQSESQRSLIDDKKILQETLSRMSPFMNNANPILLTQPVPSVGTHEALQREFHSANKVDNFGTLNKAEAFSGNKVEALNKAEGERFPKVEGFPKPSDFGYPQQSESEISSSLIEKSLSGIMNRIPLSKKQREEDGDASKEIAKFYQRKYKVKPFRPFEYVQSDENESMFVIPSVSNFLQSKNAADELRECFEKDIRNYKRLEKERELKLLKEKAKSKR